MAIVWKKHDGLFKDYHRGVSEQSIEYRYRTGLRFKNDAEQSNTEKTLTITDNQIVESETKLRKLMDERFNELEGKISHVLDNLQGFKQTVEVKGRELDETKMNPSGLDYNMLSF